MIVAYLVEVVVETYQRFGCNLVETTGRAVALADEMARRQMVREVEAIDLATGELWYWMTGAAVWPRTGGVRRWLRGARRGPTYQEAIADYNRNGGSAVLRASDVFEVCATVGHDDDGAGCRRCHLPTNTVMGARGGL